MTVLRHKGTGLLATVSDERARALPGSDWAPVEAEKPKPVPSTRRRASKTTEDE